MNPRLEQLHPYPFQKLRELFAGVTPNPERSPIDRLIGERSGFGVTPANSSRSF